MTNLKNSPPKAAFIPIGIVFIVLGITQNVGLIAAGVLFMISGFNAINKHKKELKEGGEEQSP